MSDGFVADASVALGWVHPAQATALTNQLLQAIYDGAPVEVPAIWPLEISNALLVLVRRKKLLDAERVAALSALQRIAVRIDYEMSVLAFTKLSAMAAEHQLSVYDAAYWSLHREGGCRLRVTMAHLGRPQRSRKSRSSEVLATPKKMTSLSEV